MSQQINQTTFNIDKDELKKLVQVKDRGLNIIYDGEFLNAYSMDISYITLLDMKLKITDLVGEFIPVYLNTDDFKKIAEFLKGTSSYYVNVEKNNNELVFKIEDKELIINGSDSTFKKILPKEDFNVKFEIHRSVLNILKADLCLDRESFYFEHTDDNLKIVIGKNEIIRNLPNMWEKDNFKTPSFSNWLVAEFLKLLEKCKVYDDITVETKNGINYPMKLTAGNISYWIAPRVED